MKLFGTDGIRGEANVLLTPELAFKVGSFFRKLPENKQDNARNGYKAKRTSFTFKFSCRYF